MSPTAINRHYVGKHDDKDITDPICLDPFVSWNKKNLFLVSSAAIVQLVTRSHGNICLDSHEPAGAADNSDVPAAAMLKASSFSSACGSSCSSAQVRHSLPSCS